MKLEDFLLEKDVDSSRSPADINLIERAEKLIGVEFGSELREYIQKYGYLGYGFVELYGMDKHLDLESDMIKQTMYLHHYYPKTEGYVAIENQGEGDYYLVNDKDEVFEFITNKQQLVDIRLTLFAYIMQRFTEVDE